MDAPRSIRQLISPPIILGTVLLLTIAAVGAERVAQRFLVESSFANLEHQLATVATLFSVEPEAVSSAAVLETIARRNGIELYSVGFADGTVVAPVADRFPPEILETIEAARNATVARSGPPPLASARPFIVVRAATGPRGTWYFVAIQQTDSAIKSMRRIRQLLAISVVIVALAFLALSIPALGVLTGPIRQLIDQSAQFAAGNLEQRSRIWAPREFKQLSDNLNEMAAELDDQIQAIRNQRNELDTVLATMTEALVLVNGENRIRTMNDAANRLFSAHETEESRHLLMTVRNAEIADLVQEARETGWTAERSITLYRSEQVDLHVRATPLELGDDRMVLLVISDVTRVNRLERIRQDFVSSVSHELKTPITAIQGFVETLADGSLDDAEESERFLEIILGHAHRLGAIVEDLLQLSRVEQNGEEIVTGPFRMEEVVHAARFAVEAKANERNVTIDEFYSGSPECVGNQGLLEHALINVMDNAVKYSPGGASVTVRCASRSEAFTFEVTDEGPGIPAAERDRIFERFYRVDKGRSRDLGGTGLGLAIVKHVARVHGGAVTVSDRPGGGSVFTIQIPHSRQS